jgi:hypothetical protein
MSKVAFRLLLSILFIFIASSLFVTSSEAQICAPDAPHIEGEWTTLPYLMPINPISTTLLHNGKVLMVPGSENDAWNNSSGSDSYRYAIWDPAGTTLSSITVNKMSYDVFCSGTAALPDGRALVVGGTSAYSFTGENRSSIFDPVTGSFLQSQSMADGRWYGTTTALGDGRIMVFSGISLSGGNNNTVEIYDLKNAGAGWTSPATAPFTPPLFPRMMLLPNGKVFYNGYGDGTSSNSWIFDPTPRTWTVSAPTTTNRGYGSAVILPLLAPNYTPKVMNFGGGGNSSTEIIDLSAASPKYTAGPNMSTGRTESNAVILPNGKVLVEGGSVTNEIPDAPGRTADLYDPSTNTFSTGGTSSFSRLYHSTALLLPDATVASMGSNPGDRGTYEPGIEIYRPPYLFKANDEPVTDRPTITSVSPGVIGYNSAFSVNYSSTLAIASAVLIRTGSSTHATDMEQRLIGLCGPSPQPACNGSSGTLTLTSPPNGNIAPPGYYMLFLLDSAGVPSIAQFIQLSPYSTAPPDGTITSPASNTTITAGGAVSFGTSTTAAKYSWIFPGGSTATSTAQNPGNVTFNTAGTYVASLTVSDSSGNTDPSPSTRTITVLPTTANFSIAVNPTAVAVVPGQSASYTVTVTPLTGFKGTVNLSVGSESGFPTGITSGGFSPASITSSGSSTLTINTTTSAAPYALSLTITGTSGSITHTSSTTLLVNLAPPASLAATAGNAQVALSWPATGGANGYNIKRAPIAGGPYVMVGCATTTSYTDTGLLNGKSYYYVVSATYSGSPNAGGESRNSIEASATPQAVTPPPPTGLTATPGNSQVTLNWNASPGASSYNVKRATINGGPYTTITSPFSTNYTDSGLSNNTTYYYVVSAVNSGGESANSSQLSATPLASAPTLTSLSPNSATAGGPAFTLTVNGSNFVSGATVRWNGTARVTTFVGSTQLTAAVLASDIAIIGTAQVTVLNPDGTISNSLTFTVNASPIGVVAAYSFNEGAGTTVGDSSGYNNAGTISGASWTTQGKYGNALSFNGVNNYVTIPANSTVGNLTSNFTMSAWVYQNNLTSVHTIWDTAESPSSNAGLAFKVLDTTGRLELTTKGVKDYDSLTASVPTGVWTHVAVVLDSSFDATFFVNGVQKDTITHTVGGNANTAQATFIGGAADNGVNPLRFWMDGKIDNLRIYNRALSQTEIQTDMNTPIGAATNTAPTISTIAPQTINEDTATNAIPFTVGDGESAAGNLTVSGSSSNTTLVPNANIVFGGSGANRTVTLTPAANQNGTATITVTVSDGQLSTPTSFLLTVNAVNDAPTITTLADQSTTSGTAVGPLSFTVGDVETAAASLTLSGSSSNTTLVPNANIVFGGSGANRTVTVTPAAAQTGTATITVSVSDGQLSTPTSFLLTVTATNTVPTITAIADQVTNEDTPTGAIAFTVGDNETAAGSLTVSGSSTNTTLVPNANIVFGGSGANRTVTVTPAQNQNGTATITITVSDGQLSTPTSFLLTVNAVNDAPTITAIADQTTTSGTAVGPISFTVGDVETAAGSLTVSGSSSNTTLVPNANIVFGGSGANRTVTVTPAAAQTDTATITVSVSDGLLTTPISFLLTVNADLTAPDTTITASPSNPSTSTSASFSFTSTEPGSYQCQLDGAGFGACTSPQNYTGLSEGNHNFQVQAVDLAGNIDPTPASYLWTIDTIAPDTTITSAPSNPSNSSSASFIFTSTEAGSFQCLLDGGSFAACTSPQNYAGLAQGSHAFQVRAIDLAGNIDPTPASYTWMYTPVILFPSSAVILAGSLQNGTATNLNANDNNYYSVNSTTSGNRTTSWYGSFTGVSSNLTNLKITYGGKNSRNVTQTIAIWNWTANTWVQLDSRNVSTSEILINLSPLGTLSSYVSPTGELRIQVQNTGNRQSFVTSGDLMQIVYDIP